MVDGVDDAASAYGEGIRLQTVSNAELVNPTILNTKGIAINVGQHSGKVNENVEILSPKISAWAGTIGIACSGNKINITGPQISDPVGTDAGYLIYGVMTDFTITGGILEGETTGHKVIGWVEVRMEGSSLAIGCLIA
jgi:hypothetical protein